MSLPLQGIKVVELGQLIAGPFAAKILAEFGAEVIKVEPPLTGDPLRKWRLLHNGTSVWWAVQSRNKQAVTLDLRQPQAQEMALNQPTNEPEHINQTAIPPCTAARSNRRSGM